MKRPRRLRAERAGRGGWSRWVQPVMARYWLQCCDCGLIHEMQFRIAANRDGSRQAVQFRGRRARSHD